MKKLMVLAMTGSLAADRKRSCCTGGRNRQRRDYG